MIYSGHLCVICIVNVRISAYTVEIKQKEQLLLLEVEMGIRC